MPVISGSQIASGSISQNQVKISGSLSETGEVVVSVEGAVSAIAGDYSIVQNSTTLDIIKAGLFVAADASTPLTITLPKASNVFKGVKYTVKDVNGLSRVNPIVINAASGDTIDDKLTISLTSNYESITLVCNNVNKWHIA